jgi:hypothetical protein
MNTSKPPKPYNEWRQNSGDREEDAAHTFGYDLMQYCRDKALKKVESDQVPTSKEEFHTQVALAVDTSQRHGFIGGILAN